MRMVKDAGAGLVCGFVTVPMMISYSSIIFRDQGFSAYSPSTVKLVLFSAFVHQIATTVCSKFPFSVGQVNDAGLIFLSGMATDIVSKCHQAGIPDDEMMATTLVTLAVSTFLLGAMLIVAGHFNAATLMQYLPMPVVGGYLAFAGLFSLEAGLSMMTGVSVGSLMDMLKLFVPHYMILFLPGLTAGVLLYKLMCTVKSSFTMPAYLGSILILFYGILFGCGYTLQDARDYGWISPLTPQTAVLQAFEMYAPGSVHWGILLDQFPRWAGMFIVVAFGSSLGVAAIEMELGLPLDYNKELQTVGMSNLMSGLGGGYTGSYIFTQCVFLMRSGVSSKAAGFALALLNLGIVCLPISITAYVPRLLFGALLVNIAAELMYVWLIDARFKMVQREYVVCLLSFLAIVAYGVEIGLTLGVMCSMTLFVHTYASVSTVTVSRTVTSKVLRNFEERAVLFANKGQIVTVHLSGYIFFGSALPILTEVKKNVVITGEVVRTGRKTTGGEEDCDQFSVSRQSRTRTRSMSSSGSSNRRSHRIQPVAVSGSQTLGLPPLREDMEDVAPVEGDIQLLSSAYQPILGPGDEEEYMSVYEEEEEERDRAMTLDEIMQNTNVYGMSGQQMTAHYERWKVATDEETTDPVFPFIDPQTEPEDEVPLQLGDGEGEGEGEEDIEGEGENTLEDGMTEENDIENGLSTEKNMKENDSSGSYRYEAPKAYPNAEISDPPQSPMPFTPAISRAQSEMPPDQPVLDVVWDSESIFRRRRAGGDSTTTATALPPVDDGTERSSLLSPSGPSTYGAIAPTPTPVFAPLKRQQSFGLSSLAKVKTEFLVLDFTGVVGIDATAARTCFLMLMQLMRSSGIPIVYANMKPTVKSLLECHEVLRPTDVVKPQLDIALEYCESQILDRAVQQKKQDADIISPDIAKTTPEIFGLQRILLDYLEVDTGDKSDENDIALGRVLSFMSREVLQQYFVRESASLGQILYERGAPGDKVYFVEKGAIDLVHPAATATGFSIDEEQHLANSSREKKVVAGGLFGETCFFLGKPHSCRAVVTEDCVLWTLDRPFMALLNKNEPQLCVLVQHLLLKSMALSSCWDAMQNDPSFSLLFE